MSVLYHYGKFPPENLEWNELATPLARASDALARYDSFLGIIPDSEVLISTAYDSRGCFFIKNRGNSRNR